MVGHALVAALDLPNPRVRDGVLSLLETMRISVLDRGRFVRDRVCSAYERMAEAEALVLGEDAWRAISSLATPRHGHAMAAARGRVYVIGGGERPIFAAVDVVESFAP